MNQAMLMKPPSILDEIVSQDSENFTIKSNAASAVSKKKKKQNTIRIGTSPQDGPPRPKDYDNQSVHSNTSGRSKGKKTKETTLARPKITQSPKVQKQDDNHSVHSTGSRHSHKSAKKENTIMQRPKLQGAKRTEPLSSAPKNEQLSFKAAWGDDEESEINGYEISNQRSPQVVNYQPKYQPQPKKQKIQNKPSSAKFSPFAEIEHQYSDEEPVIKLQQPIDNKTPVIMGGKKPEPKPRKVQEYRPAAVEQKSTFVESRLNIEESNVVFGQSKLRQTKSRRRNIFDRTLQNESKVSNSIAESSASGLQDTTRRKSKSRLRQLFNSSRDKDRQDSREAKDVKQSENNMVPMCSKPLQSKEFNQSALNRSNFKPVVGANDKLVHIQQKVLDKDNDDFYLEQSRSDLNLSTSNNMGKGQLKDKDSLIFQFEPEKRKGMSVTSKQKIFVDRSGTNMVNLQNQNLASMKTYPNATSSSNQLPKLGNNLHSKQLQNVQKILKQNEEYLKSNEEQGRTDNKFKKQAGKDVYLFNIQDQESEDPNSLNIKNNEKPWHQIVGQYRNEVIPIKTVQRNEKILSKEDRDAQKVKQRDREREQEREREKEQEQKQERERERQLKEKRERELKQKKEREERQKREKQRLQKQNRQRQRQLQTKLERQQRQRDMQEQEVQLRSRQQLQADRRREEDLKKRELQRQIELQMIQRQQQEQRQRKTEKARKEAQRRKQERQQMTAKQTKQIQEAQLLKLNSMPSSFSRDDSDNKSEKSNKSGKNVKRKKQSSMARDKNHNKAYVRNQSPRAEESYYQSSEQESEKRNVVQQLKQEKKLKIISFSDDEDASKPKSKTQMNFYDYTQSQKSIKPPSSKPPLSKKSNGSASVSKEKKPKEKTIAINIKEQGFKKVDKPKQKKMTLMERARMKHNESNDSCSQDSYRENFSSDSRKSNSSRNSKRSLKKESTLNITGTMIHSKCGKPPMEKKYSLGSQHEDELLDIEKARQYERQREVAREKSLQKIREMKNNVMNERMIVSKNCTFIDEKGRLVQKDLIIKGREVYGVPGNAEDSSQYFLDRMRRSRDELKQRSKSRDKNKLSKKGSRDGSESGSCNQGSSYASSSFYENNPTQGNSNGGSGYAGFGGNTNQGNILREFIKPVEQVPMYTRQEQSEIPKNNKKQPKTLNEMFIHKNSAPLNYNNSNLGQSRASKKSLGRTQKSRGRK